MHARRQRSRGNNIDVSTPLFLTSSLHKYRDASLLANKQSPMTSLLQYLTFSFEISSPCTKINSRTRLYNAAASPASRLRLAGSLAIIINYYYYHFRYHYHYHNYNHYHNHYYYHYHYYCYCSYCFFFRISERGVIPLSLTVR